VLHHRRYYEEVINLTQGITKPSEKTAYNTADKTTTLPTIDELKIILNTLKPTIPSHIHEKRIMEKYYAYCILS